MEQIMPQTQAHSSGRQASVQSVSSLKLREAGDCSRSTKRLTKVFLIIVLAFLLTPSVSSRAEQTSTRSAVSGDLLGAGGPSQAVFSNIQVQQVLWGFTCSSAPQVAVASYLKTVPIETRTGFSSPRLMSRALSPESCPSPTGETNNFMNGPNTSMRARDFGSGIYWKSSSPRWVTCPFASRS